MEHDYDCELDWCRRCGRPRYELFELEQPSRCDGLAGVIHQRYVTAKREFHEFFDPVVRAVFSASTTQEKM